jgi:aerobic carbon-monoxide dehydrogenase medium subunit
MVAASYRIADGRIAEPRLAVGGVEDRPRRILEAERCLAGATLTGEAFREAASVAAAAVDPLEDGINDAAFRRSLLLALVPQALERAA